VDFAEICNVYVGKMIIKAAKRISNSDKICRSYSDLNFVVTFFGTVYYREHLWLSGSIQKYFNLSSFVRFLPNLLKRLMGIISQSSSITTTVPYSLKKLQNFRT